MLSPCHP
jgi:hypothetical protein